MARGLVVESGFGWGRHPNRLRGLTVRIGNGRFVLYGRAVIHKITGRAVIHNINSVPLTQGDQDEFR